MGKVNTIWAGRKLFALDFADFAGLSAQFKQGFLQVWSADPSQLNPLPYSISFGRNTSRHISPLTPGQTSCAADQSGTDAACCLPRGPGRKLLTCQQALGKVQEMLIDSWHPSGGLRLQLSEGHCTFKHSCWGGRGACSWVGYRDTGLSRAVPVFLVWVSTEMTTKGWLGAEADGKDRNMSPCTHNKQLCVSPNHKQVFKEELILFPGLLWWSGIHSRNCFQSAVCFYTQLAEYSMPQILVEFKWKKGKKANPGREPGRHLEAGTW